MIQMTIWESALTLYSLSPSFTISGVKINASTLNTAPLPVSQIIHTADSPALTDSRLPTTPLNASARRRMSSATVSARQAVHAPRPAPAPKRRGDGSAVVFVQKGDPSGLPAASMAVVPMHGNVSTPPVISRVVRAYLTHTSCSACSVSPQY
jgi:hypothetical protein